MDTLENETPVGEAGATASPDTASAETQPVESADSVSDGQTEEAGEASEKLLAGKYKSPEELEKAYSELQSKLGEVGRKAEIANLLEQKTGMNADQIKRALAEQEEQRMRQAIAENPGLAAYQKVAEMESKLALINEERELDSYLSSEGQGYQKNREKLLWLGLQPENHNKTYAELANEWFGEVRAQGQQDAYRKIETKKNTQATGVSQAAPKSKLTLEDLDNMSVKEMELALPWADITNRPY